jgi:hypothetical protein
MQDKAVKQSKRRTASTRMKSRVRTRPVLERGRDVGDVRLQLLLIASVPPES